MDCTSDAIDREIFITTGPAKGVKRTAVQSVVCQKELTMKACVTGATGFLGRRLVRSLCLEGLQVRCLVRRSSDLVPLKSFLGEAFWRQVDVVRCELSDVAACRSALEDCSVLYHTAAGLSGSPSTLFLSTVVGTRRILEAALQAAVRRFVLVSSLGVYGSALLKAGTVVDEQTPIDPAPHLRDPYTYSKIVQEQVAWEAFHERKLPLVVVRPGVIFGDERGVLSGRIGLRLGRCLIRMGGRQSVPYTYVENCAAAIRQAGLVPQIAGEVFNILDDDLPTAAQVLRWYRKAGGRIRSFWLPGPLIGTVSGFYEWYHHWSRGQLPGVITRYKSAAMWNRLKYSNEKARRMLAWEPAVPIQEAIFRSMELSL